MKTEMDTRNCPICKNEGWVCEEHPARPWGFGDACCGGAGMPCICNKVEPPWEFVPTGYTDKIEPNPAKKRQSD